MSASNFDIEKFRKVHALMKDGATEGERAAAKNRCEAIAAKAGLTLKQAVSKLGRAKPKNEGGWSGHSAREWADRYEREQREKEASERRRQEELHRQAREREEERERERQAKFAARRAEIMAEFGSVKAFLDRNPREEAILKAADQFITEWSEPYEDACGTWRRSVAEFAGVSDHFSILQKVDPAAIEAIKTAYLFPITMRDMFEELRSWDKLERERAHFYCHNEYYFDLPVELRIDLLREEIRTRPVTCWEDMEIRLHYKSYAWQQQWIEPQDFDDPEWARMCADVQILRQMYKEACTHQNGGEDTASATPGGAQVGRRRNADIRKSVLSMLDAHPELSDREIGRRVGVSPQTVSNWRARMKREAA
ncbi:winged helix-turn-helix domain-containing protein [Allorhizobium borbori]|uniref:Homeodomain-like domain-containing protein n=1 Tax=Allorhizobium borbori TaxID=485907 RepID=A0A7W6K1R2_9HYPH|nr:winged helix-turn-helix domain-containing protein [Allorhizobium borbori]MBB4103558.1 hypothetical protein [Allorhizobium borbori]